MTVFPWPVKAADEDGDFISRLPFPPDDFQRDAFAAVDADHSVLVSAPTGSGKTLVAAYAIHRALGASGKAFYTTPLKALSNQKYGELVATYGKDHVGLLTGDTAVRPDAPMVVMTTEVLRNMLLAGSDLLAGLHTVILDEVHFIQDPYRGGVWEEVLVLSPPEVRFVCLSATVNNASELGAWLRSVRGTTEVIVERHRPIELRHHFAAHRRDDNETLLLPLLVNGKPGSEGLRIDQAIRRSMQGRPAQWQPRGKGPRLPYRSPLRTELISALEEEEMLPAIVFIFSRAACDEAVRQVVRDGVRLTDGSERTVIRQIAERRVETLSDEDLGVLGYDEWLEGLESGVASHHAGLVPVFRETVEECFSAGLLRVVFATETLSLGINMPARSVVIERFTKYGGAGRATLTSGEYLQLTGRAGRRGLDEEGHAVALWSTETAFSEAARVASAPPPDLRSSFRPTYNLAVNLASRFDRRTAEDVLRRSFAQWQAQRADLLTIQLSHRVGVLEGLGYLKGWSLTSAGHRLSRIYHESDLLVAEALAADLFSGTEASVLAGVVSAVIFEPRRARRLAGHGGPGARAVARRGRRKSPLSDRLGEKRVAELQWRCAALEHVAERIRTLEEVHLVPRTRQPSSGLATAVASWARGASFETALAVAARDVGDLAPGDFVRTVKSVADLAQQVAHAATDPQTAGAAREAVGMLLAGSSRPVSRPPEAPETTPNPAPGLSATRAASQFYGGSGMFPYVEEQFSADEEAILRRYMTNLHLPVFALVNLPEVVKGAFAGRYSRSPKSLRRLFLDEFVGDLDISGDLSLDATVGLERAEQLYEKVFVEYGDDSVAQLGGVHLACEQSSNVLSKVLEWGRLMSYLEQSTRYIAYDNRLDSGHYRYFRPTEILESPYGARYVGDMDRVFDTYGALLPAMRTWVTGRFPQQAGDTDFVYRQAVKAKSLDALRGLLPAASLSNIGLYGTGQSYEQLLLRMRAHPLPEARSYASMMLTELRKVIPSFLQRVDVAERGGEWTAYLASTRDATARVVDRLWPDGEPSTTSGQPEPEVSLLDYDPDGEEKVLAAACFSHLRCSEHQAVQRVRLLSHDERVALLTAYVGDRRNRRHRPGRAFERTDYRFELVTDYGAFRDLQRHRMLTIEWQRLGIGLGYDMPELVVDAGMGDGYAEAIERAEDLYRTLAPEFPEQAPYAVALAHRIRYVIQCNAREAMHLIELRSGAQGHPAYRRVAQEMHRAIGEHAGHRALADAMTFVDHGTTDLERLESERRSARRRAEKSSTP